MKLCMIGDFDSNNGPAIANRSIINALTAHSQNTIKHSRFNNKILRIIEIIFLVFSSNNVFICSKSNVNYFLVFLSKLLNKKVLYLAHGFAEYEYSINSSIINIKTLSKLRKYEKTIYDNVDVIVCVSKKAKEKMIELFPQHRLKIDYIYNIVDVTKLSLERKNNGNKQNQILSVGGGLKIKNNLIIAQAINKSEVKNMVYYVIGAESNDGAQIKSYKNVKYETFLSHDKLMRLMSQTKLYIQNSTFETFGLAVIEALASGASILVSKNVGCIDLLSTIQENDIINDVNDVDEIARKIKILLNESNNARLLTGLRLDKCTPCKISYKIDLLIKNLNKS